MNENFTNDFSQLDSQTIEGNLSQVSFEELVDDFDNTDL